MIVRVNGLEKVCLTPDKVQTKVFFPIRGFEVGISSCSTSTALVGSVAGGTTDEVGAGECGDDDMGVISIVVEGISRVRGWRSLGLYSHSMRCSRSDYSVYVSTQRLSREIYP